MACAALFIAHAPDAEPERERALVDTRVYRLLTVVVKDQGQAPRCEGD